MKKTPSRKSIAGLLLSAIMSFGCSAEEQHNSTSENESPIYQLPQSPISKCINVGNALDAPNEGDWTYRIEDYHLKAIADAGFDTVRVPIRWSAHALATAPYTIDPVFFDRVEHVVNTGLDYGLQVIVDVHHYDGIMQSPDEHYERLDQMWRQIAKRFSGRGDRIIFEVLNEAHTELTNSKLAKLNSKVLTTIRNNAGSEPWIILGGDEWGNLSGIEDARFPDDPRTILTFHDYSPFPFTHQGATFTVEKYPLGREWGSEKEKKELKALFEDARKIGKKWNKPIFMGEFGVIDGVPNSWRAEYIEQYRRKAEEAHIGWCLWDFGASFAIYDVSTREWEPKMLDALMSQ